MAAKVCWCELTDLILVAGHAVYIAEDFTDPLSDASWYLQDFQKGEPRFYLEHIRKGVELADKCRHSLLVFSGGQTRFEAGPRSEAQSYWLLADHYEWFWRTNVRQRATTEEFARDSFENLLFGICRFHEATGHLPTKVRVVGWAFKETRFGMHREAMGWPEGSDHYQYVGVNDPDDLEGARKGEEMAIWDFDADPYGIDKRERKMPDGKKRSGLGTKRTERNPSQRRHPYDASYPALKKLLGDMEARTDEIPQEAIDEVRCPKDPEFRRKYDTMCFGWPPDP